MSGAVRTTTIAVLAVIAALAVPGAIGWLAWHNSGGMVRAASLVTHTHEVLAELDTVAGRVAEAEAGQRTYLLTGRKDDLTPYAAACDAVHRHLGRLQDLVRDDSDQSARLADLRTHIDDRIASLQKTIDVRASAGTTKAVQRITEGAGVQERKAIEAVIDEMVDQEHRLLDGRLAAFQKAAETTTAILAGAAGVVLLLVVVMGLMVRRDARQRRLALARLRASELRYRSIIASLHEGILLYGPGGRVLAANTSAQDILGLSADQLAAADRPHLAANMVHEDGQPFAIDQMPSARAEATGEPQFGITMGLRREKGGTTWLSANAQPLFMEQADGAQGVVVSFTDITARKEAEERLRQSEERFRLLVDNVEDYAILMLDPQGRVVSWNAGAQRIKGYSAEEIVGQHFSRFYTPEDIALGKPQHELDVASREGRFEDEGWRVRKDGSRFFANVVVSAVRDSTGRLLGFAKITRDITERVRGEQAVRSSEARFRALLESAPDSIVIVDQQAKIVLVNSQAEKMFGYRRQEMLGQAIEMLVPESRRLAHVGERSAYIASPRTRPMGAGLDIVGRRQDGSEVPLEISLSPIPTEQGMLISSVIRDITGRKRVEAAFARHAASMDLLRSAAMAANEASTVEQAMQTCLDSICAFMKWPIGHLYLPAEGRAEELVSTKVWHLDDPVRFSDFRQATNGARYGPGADLPGRVLAEGKPVWIRDVSSESGILRAPAATAEGIRAGFAFPILVGDQVSGVLEFFATEVAEPDQQLLDVMQQIGLQLGRVLERRRADRELRSFNLKLRQSNRELEDFASVASHDLQEPLRKVQAFGDRLKTRHGGELGTEGRDYLERMQGAAGRMQTLITDLLTFSRVTSKAQPFVPVDLGKVAAEVVCDLEVRIEQSGAAVDVQPLPTIDADPLQMRQLLQNLIGNALKFVAPSASPRVRVYAQSIQETAVHEQGSGDGNPDAAMARLFVEDNGIGFDEKYLDRIFMVFQRLHGRQEYAGTGIGLAVCRKIAERHSGSITARSQVGQGSTFIVTLPVRQMQGEYFL